MYKYLAEDMLARTINKLFGQSHVYGVSKCRVLLSTAMQTGGKEPDPAPLFFDSETQKALKALTRIDYKKLFRTRLTGKKLQRPQYRFMTDENLKDAMKTSMWKAEKYLQMPPVLKARKEIDKVLSKDPALQGFSTCKHVFVDISFGISDQERLMVVREPDGTLRHAKWEERDRLNQIYFPREGKKIPPPKLFSDPYLQDILNCKEYERLLDHACIQYEPDDPEYIRITKRIYEEVNMLKDFEYLRSTRHFGPFVFHLLWNKNIDKLLCDIIQSGRIEEAGILIRLFHKIHPEAESAVNKCNSNDDKSLIRHYAALDSSQAGLIERTLLAYEELEKAKQEVAEGIKKAHGIVSTKS